LIKQYPGSEKNTRKKFLGFKLKKEKFVRAVNERKITSENAIEPILSSGESELIEDFRVHETLDQLNMKLQQVLKKLERHNTGDEQISRIYLNFDKIIIDSQPSLIEQSLIEIQEDLVKAQSFIEENPKLSTLLQRGLLISKQKYSKIDLTNLDNQSLNQISQQNLKSLEGKTPLEVLYAQTEQLNKVKFQEDEHPRYIKNQYHVDLQVLTDIRSDVDISDEDDRIYQASSVSNAKPLRFERSSGYKSNTEAGKLHNQKMKFYSAAVNIRLDLPPGHPGREFDIGRMYNESLEKNVAENEWNSFLKSKFQI